MRHLLILGGLTAATLLVGCSNTRRCETEQDYQTARTIAVPGDVDGMSVPESQSALRIPPAPEQDVPFGMKYVDKKSGKTQYACLDTPPRLKVSAPAPVLTKQEEKAANAKAMKREAEPAETSDKPAEPAPQN